jgi:hypothetical protein
MQPRVHARALALALALAFTTPAALAEPFTFQAYVESAGTPINGSADLAFRIYDAASGGTQIGSTVTQASYPVAKGVFTIDLDAGAALAFDGAARFLEVEVDGQVLSPRLEILPTPLASSSNALRGRAVSAATPASGQVLTWTGSQWAPQAPSGTGAGTSYNAGTGLALAGTTFSMAPSYQLPQSCSNQQVAKWNGSAWTCAADADANTTYSAASNGGLLLAGTAFRADFGGDGAATTVARSDHGHFGDGWSGTATSGLSVTNNSAEMASSAVLGIHAGNANSGTGVRGESTTSTTGVGVFGRGFRGVWGQSESVGTGTGVYGWRFVAGGSGVHGHASGDDTTVAVRGTTVSPGGDAIVGDSSATGSGDGVGVRGQSSNAAGTGVYGKGTTGVAGEGVDTGVVGSVSGATDAIGVLGFSAHPTASVRGVKGLVLSPDGIAVYGENHATSGNAYGLAGATSSSAGTGVVGLASAGGKGVRGEGRIGLSASGTESGLEADGVAYGVRAGSSSASGTGVLGEALSGSGSPIGVHGRTSNGGGVAMRAENTATAGNGNALVATGSAGSGDTLVVTASGLGNAWAIKASSAGDGGRALSAELTGVTSSGIAVYGQVTSATARAAQFANLAGGEAARFDGNVNVVGNHTVTGTKSFRIDHPLDPENSYLYHYNLEGPEPFNLYRGTVTLDANGAAQIGLPEYFEQINTDVTYQLTAVGAPMPNLHVSKEMQGDRFSVAGGAPGRRVSWQITALRNDVWVQDHGIHTEVEKPATEKGRYLYPKGYGQAESKAIGFADRMDKTGAQ